MTNASTMTPTSAGGFTESALDAFSKVRDEPAWLAARRKAALALFQTSPWPTLRDEEWSAPTSARSNSRASSRPSPSSRRYPLAKL